MAQETVGFGGFIGRFLFALVLVLATFNPTGYSFYHWASTRLADSTALVVLAGVVLLIGWAVFLRATMRSLGFFGVALLVALFAALIWVAVTYGWLQLDNTRLVTWIVLVIVAAVLALGMSWSHLRRRLSGQADVDEVSSR
jgi:predicted neutral ceramidase superfamily lipid hydrolase